MEKNIKYTDVNCVLPKYDIEMLQDYVKNNSECNLIDFQRNKTSHIVLKLKCDCGNIFEVMKKHFDNGKKCCNECNGVNRWNFKSLSEHVTNNSECTLIDFNRERRVYKTNIKLNLKCKCGNNFIVEKGNFDSGEKKCKICNGFSDKYGKSLAEISPESVKYWDYEMNYPLTPSDISYASGKKFWFKCEKGIHESTERIVNCFSGGNKCRHCSNEQLESKLATSLKLIFKNVYTDTIWEANLGVKSKNGKDMPYDIYVPSLNLVIECQSEYHDSEDQSNRDKIKREYAISNGYKFIEIDSRDYTVDEAVEIFFGKNFEYKEILSNTTNTKINWNIKKAQYLLDNSRLTYEEIGKLVGTTKGAITSSINRGQLIKKKGRKTNINSKNKRKVNQLSLNGIIIKTFNSIRQAEEETGCDNRNISACCRGKIKTLGGFKWEYCLD